MAKILLRSIDSRSVNNIVKAVRKAPRLSNAFSLQLVKLAQQGDESARDYLVQGTLWRVVNIALQYLNKVPGACLEDMIQDGNIGVLIAIEKFDADKCTDFTHYVSACISDRIKDGLDNDYRTIRLPHNSYTLLRKIQRIQNEYIQEFGIEATEEELAEITGATREHVHAVTKLAVSSYNAPARECPYANDGECTSLIDLLAAEEDNFFEAEERKVKVAFALDALSKRDRAIIAQLYGIGCVEMNMQEVAKIHGLCRERIRQIEKKALETMCMAFAA